MRMNKAQIDAARIMFEQMVYESELDCAVRKARRVLAPLGCKVFKAGSHVTFWSPKTGSHNLNMTLGVRPVSDLLAHLEGFAEQQPKA